MYKVYFVNTFELYCLGLSTFLFMSSNFIVRYFFVSIEKEEKPILCQNVMLMLRFDFFPRRKESDSEPVIIEGNENYSLPSKCAWLIETDL